MRTRILLSLVCSIFALVGCAPAMNDMNHADQSSDSVGVNLPPEAPLPSGQILKIQAPENMKLGSCTPFQLDWASPSSVRRGTIRFPDSFKGKIFVDSECRSELSSIDGEVLPFELHFRSDSLFFGTLSAEFTMDRTKSKGPSNAIDLNVYRASFLNSEGSFNFSIASASSLQGRSFFYIGTDPTDTANLSNPTGLVIPDLALPENRLLSSVFGGNGRSMGFSRNRVFAGSLTVDARANAVTNFNQPAGQLQACYSSKNEVFCRAGTSTTFTKVALPAGRVADLKSGSGAPTCAIVDGRIYCWRSDLAVQEVTAASSGNIQLTIVTTSSTLPAAQALTNGNFCVLKDFGQLQCSTGGAGLGTVADGIRRVSSGRNGSISFVRTGIDSTFTYEPTEQVTAETYGTFDEVIPSLRVANCGRRGKNLYCWNPDFVGTPDPVPGITLDVD